MSPDRLPGVRAVWGVVLVARPEAVGAGHPAAVRIGARLLGARHVAEGLWLAARGQAPPPALAAIDTIHAASMVAVARWAPSVRRPVLLSGAISVGLAAASAAQRRRER